MFKTVRKHFRQVKAKVNAYPRGRVRTAAVAICGAALLCIGLVMLVLPGPGLLFIAVGLAVLSVEFAWAKALVRRGREAAVVLRRRYRKSAARRRVAEPSSP